MPHRTPPTDPIDSESAENDESVGSEVRRTLADVAPWAVSILAHLVLVVLALFLVWSTVLNEEEEPWNGEVAINAAPPISPVDFPVQDPTEDTARPRTDPIPQVEPVTPTIRNPGLDQPFAAPAPALPGPPRFDDGPGDIVGPGNPVIGTVGRQTVFVIDASGSLIDTFPMVIHELKRLLHDLDRAEQQRQSDPARRSQKPFAYAVVFFRDGEVLVQDRRGLRTAETEAVGRSVRWLDGVSPGGSTSPLPAIELALSYHPDTVIILSDNITGRGINELDADRLVDRVLDARGDRRIAINTVQFLYPDPQEAFGGTGTLRRLAEETGGTYKFVSDRELNLR